MARLEYMIERAIMWAGGESGDTWRALNELRDDYRRITDVPIEPDHDEPTEGLETYPNEPVE